ncbi:MAG: hypothetical protein LH619_11475 [Chitinophagaceae bacterium]|nr:hypothetical protein [Chitinophagaceae bacterium]
MKIKNKFELAKKELEKICKHSPKKKCEEVFCKLHLPDYLGNHNNSHACLACNLNESLLKVHKFLSQNRTKEDLEFTFTVYILLLYLLAEKLTTIFKFIGITQEYNEIKWPVLIEIRKWANFIKHPKGFLFSHHPEYLFENTKIPKQYQEWKKINYVNFVEPLYKREDETKFKHSMIEFANKKELLVIIPNPERLAKELKVVCIEVCEKIKDNKHFQEILKNNTVIENYY